MPSATTAESSDSIAPSNAKAIASGSTACALANENSGSAGAGSIDGMPPKRLAMVSTGSANAHVTTAAAATAINMPGQCGRTRFSPKIAPIVSTASASAPTLMVGKARASTSALAMISPGSLPAIVSPSRSLTWLAKMMTAMPAVKPTVTG